MPTKEDKIINEDPQERYSCGSRPGQKQNSLILDQSLLNLKRFFNNYYILKETEEHIKDMIVRGLGFAGDLFWDWDHDLIYHAYTSTPF